MNYRRQNGGPPVAIMSGKWQGKTKLQHRYNTRYSFGSSNEIAKQIF
jgi:hypothetical protein